MRDKIRTESRVAILAAQRGFENPMQFAIAAGLAWPTANNIWQGEIGGRQLRTLIVAARTLGCSIEQLYEVTG